MRQVKDVKIIIATQKEYIMPDYDIYLPLQVGAKGQPSIGYMRDDTGDNISEKNSSFCELTGLYWAWKNLPCDYLGLAHYRRHFTVRNPIDIHRHGNIPTNRLECVLSAQELKRLTKKYDMILPQKRKYYIETLYSHYSHSHYHEHLDCVRDIISERCPEYLNVFDQTMKQRSGYMFNMFIMRRDLADQYCEWLFPILFELEKRIRMPDLSQFQSRYPGRVGELLFNVWLTYQLQFHHYRVREVHFLYLGTIHYPRKIYNFLRAKIFRIKYTGSF